MGTVGSIARFMCTRVLPGLIFVIAIFLGWIGQSDLPEGKFFATLIPALKGIPPATIVGHGKMTGTPPVPDDMTPEPRPEGEILIPMLGSDSPMPANGIGMCCRPTAYDDELVKRTVLWYLLMGGRLIDSAHMYLNHRAIGEGIREAVKRGVRREEIFVTTKIWPSHFGYNSTIETVPTFLDELGLEYIDLVLMHAPVSIITKRVSKGCSGMTTTECRQETWRALSELRQKGMLRNVGVSNFAVHHLEELTSLKGDNIAPVAVNQISYNPWSLQSWVDTFEYCQQRGIAITAYNSLGGLFQHAQAATVGTLNDLATKYNKTVAQIMLRWALQMNAAIIPGTGNPEHMRENLDVYAFEISDEDMQAINALRSDESAKKFFSMEPVD